MSSPTGSSSASTHSSKRICLCPRLHQRRSPRLPIQVRTRTILSTKQRKCNKRYCSTQLLARSSAPTTINQNMRSLWLTTQSHESKPHNQSGLSSLAELSLMMAPPVVGPLTQTKTIRYGLRKRYSQTKISGVLVIAIAKEKEKQTSSRKALSQSSLICRCGTAGWHHDRLLSGTSQLYPHVR